ncbi:MAG: hypothetical protein ABIM40_15050, partial [Pseudomonadota bacterium]
NKYLEIIRAKLVFGWFGFFFDAESNRKGRTNADPASFKMENLASKIGCPAGSGVEHGLAKEKNRPFSDYVMQLHLVVHQNSRK